MTTPDAGSVMTTEDPRPLVAVVFNGTIAEVRSTTAPINLVTRDMLRAFNRSLTEVAAHADVRCMILHGGDARAFCAGSDIKEFANLRSRMPASTRSFSRTWC